MDFLPKDDCDLFHILESNKNNLISPGQELAWAGDELVWQEVESDPWNEFPASSLSQLLPGKYENFKQKAPPSSHPLSSFYFLLLQYIMSLY